MRRVLIAVIALICITSQAQNMQAVLRRGSVVSSVTTDAITRDGLIHEYLFTSDASDTSGNGYTGTPTDMSFDGTASFNGTSSFIDIGKHVAFIHSNGIFTISVWGKNLSTSEVSELRALLVSTASSSTFGFALRVDVGLNKAIFQGEPNTTNPNIYEDFTIDTNWHNYVATGNGTNAYLYADGDLLGSTDLVNLQPQPATRNTSIGKTTGGANFWYGEMDNARIYNVYITNVVQFYNEGHD